MSDIDSEKGQRGRRSPSVPLSQAVAFLTSIHHQLGTGTAGRETLAKALGHSSVNGAVTTKIGTLTHFRLLERVGNTYRGSALGRAILFPKSPEEKRQAIAEAATSPALYADILRDRAGQALPGLLANILMHDYGVHADKAAEVVDVFRESMEFAGLLRNGVLYDTPGPAEETAAAPVQAAAPAEAAAAKEAEPAEAPAEGLVDYRLPLRQGRSAVLRLPPRVEPSDLERVKKWLDLMADVLTGEGDE